MPGKAIENPAEQLEELLDHCKTLQLATSGEHGPEASYSPFIFIDGVFYVYISELASHTGNMLNNPDLGIMLIADESATRNLFARSRLTIQCRAEKMARDSEHWQGVMETMQQRHGETVGLLRSLPDFHLFRLIPERGRLVIGFGKAYRIGLPEFDLQLIEGR